MSAPTDAGQPATGEPAAPPPASQTLTPPPIAPTDAAPPGPAHLPQSAAPAAADEAQRRERRELRIKYADLLLKLVALIAIPFTVMFGFATMRSQEEGREERQQKREQEAKRAAEEQRREAAAQHFKELELEASRSMPFKQALAAKRLEVFDRLLASVGTMARGPRVEYNPQDKEKDKLDTPLAAAVRQFNELVVGPLHLVSTIEIDNLTDKFSAAFNSFQAGNSERDTMIGLARQLGDACARCLDAR